MIIDATGLKVGRLSTVVAKAALSGEKVDIINVERAVFTGSKDDLVKKYMQRHSRGGPHWGPFYPRMPDRLVRRIIRGMLPYKTPRGRDAFKRVMCYIGNPKDEKGVSIEDAHIGETMQYVTVKELCNLIGGRQ